jgi:hypothetical protein
MLAHRTIGRIKVVLSIAIVRSLEQLRGKGDRNLKPIAGEVLAHSVDRDEVYGAVSLGKGRAIAIECFAKTPDDMVFVL